MKMYYTFGSGQVDPKTHESLKNKYVTICNLPGDDLDAGRHMMISLYRDQWSMEYNDDQFQTRFGAMVATGDMTEHGHYNWDAIFHAGQEVVQHLLQSKEDEQYKPGRRYEESSIEEESRKGPGTTMRLY